MDESLFNIPNLKIIVYHWSLNDSHSISPVSRPAALKLYVVLVYLHAQAPGSEEAPSWALDTLFILYTASRINESSCSLNDFQLPKDVVLIIWCLCPWSIWSSIPLAIFKSFSAQSSEEPLSPSKELNTQIHNACYRNHVAIQDSMTTFKPPHNWPRDSQVILGAFAMGNIIPQCSKVCPNNFKPLHPCKARD